MKGELKVGLSLWEWSAVTVNGYHRNLGLHFQQAFSIDRPLKGSFGLDGVSHCKNSVELI